MGNCFTSSGQEKEQKVKLQIEQAAKNNEEPNKPMQRNK